jgi:hypothetical protein
MKFANAAPSLSMKTTSTCNEILMANIIYIYIYPIVFVCFSQVKKLAKLGNPPPLNPPKDG